MKTLLLLIFALYYSFLVRADEQPYPMHELFFNCNIIAHVKITNHTDHNYTIRLDDIFYDRGIGLNKRDYIKIKKDFNVETSTEEVSSKQIADRAQGIAFLIKTDKGWYMKEFYMDQGEDKVCYLYLKGCRIAGTVAEIKQQVIAYFNEFRLDEKGHVYGRLPVKAVKKNKLSDLVLLQYTKIFPFEIDKSVYEQLDCFDGIVAPEEE